MGLHWWGFHGTLQCFCDMTDNEDKDKQRKPRLKVLTCKKKYHYLSLKSPPFNILWTIFTLCTIFWVSKLSLWNVWSKELHMSVTWKVTEIVLSRMKKRAGERSSNWSYSKWGISPCWISTKSKHFCLHLFHINIWDEKLNMPMWILATFNHFSCENSHKQKNLTVILVQEGS